MSYSDQKQHRAQASLSMADFITCKKDLKIGSQFLKIFGNCNED